MKKTKENVYVVIDTPKKAKKVKKVLDMFGEETYQSDTIDYALRNSKLLSYSDTDNWIAARWTDDDETEVSIKELRNILAIEHLKEGDVVVVDNDCGKWIVKLTGNDIQRFEHSASYDLDLRLLNDQESIESENKIYGGSFIRYATEEEKALVNNELTIADYKLGVWYKSESGTLVYFNDTETTYGFRSNGDFMDKAEWISEFRANGFHKPGYWKEATKEEVEQALIKEAKKRGYVEGARVKCLVFQKEYTLTSRKHWNEFDGEELLMVESGDTGAWIFKNGKWAEIVEHSFVESADKINIECGSIGKRVRVIDGGLGARGANDKTGVLVNNRTVANCGHYDSTVKVETDDGNVWGLNNSFHEIEYIEESSPLTVTLEVKDIATLQVIQKTLKELEEKITKLI